MPRKFLILHQPKTAGTYCSMCLPHGYVMPHNMNYHRLTSEGSLKSEQIVCIVRNPLEYYKSLITYWCIDPRHCTVRQNYSESELKCIYENKIKENVDPPYPMHGHVDFYISNGYTLKFEEILSNLFDDDFLKNHQNILSKKCHTYDYYVFKELIRLGIGFYTFSFLDQYASKKISDIKSNEECFDELMKIAKNSIILHTENIIHELKELCKKFNVPCKDLGNTRPKQSNKPSSLKISRELLQAIFFRDAHMFNIFFKQ